MAMDLGATQTRLDALLLRWEELHDRGQTLSPEQLAADTPELIPELACRIAALRAVDAMIAPPVAASGGTVPRPLDLGAVTSPLDPSKEFRAVARMVEPSFHARGGLGEVLVARQEELGRDVALKRIRPDRLHDTARRRFLREAVITAGLQHPGIVPIYGLGQDDDGPFYTMPFIQGQTLDEAIRNSITTGPSGIPRSGGAWNFAACSSGSSRSATDRAMPTIERLCTAT